MKILYVVSTLSISGPTNQLFALVKELKIKGVEIWILTLSPEPNKSKKIEFANIGISVISNNLGRLSGFFLNRSRLVKTIALINPDIVHSQGIRSDILVAKLCLGSQHFITIHNNPFIDFIQKFGTVKGFYMAFRHSNVFSRTINIISCSKTIANQLSIKGIKSEAIQNGIEISHFPVSEKIEKQHIREKLGIDPEIKVFIAVGSLIKRKNMKIIVQAFQKFHEVNQTCLLLIAGDGVEKTELQHLSGNSNIKFLGNIPNVTDYLKISDCFVSSSRSEGLPYSVMEAMSTGLPCILSDIPSHLELMESYHDYPFFFPCDDEEALMNCFRAITNKEFKSIGDDVRKIIVNGFTSEIMADRYYQKYFSFTNSKAYGN